MVLTQSSAAHTRSMISWSTFDTVGRPSALFWWRLFAWLSDQTAPPGSSEPPGGGTDKGIQGAHCPHRKIPRAIELPAQNSQVPPPPQWTARPSARSQCQPQCQIWWWIVDPTQIPLGRLWKWHHNISLLGLSWWGDPNNDGVSSTSLVQPHWRQGYPGNAPYWGNFLPYIGQGKHPIGTPPLLTSANGASWLQMKRSPPPATPITNSRHRGSGPLSW